MPEFVNTIVKMDKIDQSPSYGAAIPLRDGRLMWIYTSGRANPALPARANFSSDQGATWSAPIHLKLTTGEPLIAVLDTNLFRLKSGGIGLVLRGTAKAGAYEADYQASIIFTSSNDEGATWSPPVTINPPGTNAVITNEKSIVHSSGRIIVPYYIGIGAKPYGDVRMVQRFGASFNNPERATLYYSSAFLSDDEGKTWRRSTNEAFVNLENGAGGSYSMGEPAVVELKDGRVLMIARTNVGRFFQSISEDRGETWMQPEPTQLACYPSPATIKRIPTTGDLIVIWNQISQWETMNGLYRHRLSTAVSKDEGKTWQHHRNLESMDDTSYIEPGPIQIDLVGKFKQPVDRKRYHRAPAPLRYNQPSCTFIGDKAIITYGMCVFGDKAAIPEEFGISYEALMEKLGIAPFDRANKVRVVSSSWFYGQ